MQIDYLILLLNYAENKQIHKILTENIFLTAFVLLDKAFNMKRHSQIMGHIIQIITDDCSLRLYHLFLICQVGRMKISMILISH